MTQRFAMPYTPETYLAIRQAVWDAGHQDDWAWSQEIEPPKDAEAFARELAFVICNSGMKNTVARMIYEKVIDALDDGRPVIDVFRHVGKTAAIEKIWRDRTDLFVKFKTAADQVEWLGTLPWIGGITKYHAAKNFGVDCVKPDIHLQRLADAHGESPTDLCRRLQGDSGDRLATVDVVLWRAAAIGLINTRELVKA